MDIGQYLLTSIFISGYLLLIFENRVKVNKAAIALLTAMALWVTYFYALPGSIEEKYGQLLHHLSDITQVLFFLIGAMTIVELIASHKGFDGIRKYLSISSPRKLFWVLSLLSFWISSVLDNLTTLLLMVSLISQTVDDRNMRQLLSAGLVFVVNLGGAWTPIGDITTTMLWIEGRVSTLPLISNLFLPSFLALALFNALYCMVLPKAAVKLFPDKREAPPEGSTLVFVIGVLGLLSVPLLKLLFDIPPFMGMMISLGLIWASTDRFHKKIEERKELMVEHILTKIDISCVLFFLGVLLSVGCLDSAALLKSFAEVSQQAFSNIYLFTMAIGILSSLVDNVPLVAGVISMFSLEHYPANHPFWLLNAYCAGVGGSLLIIGSAPGVALMSIKEISFFWYLKRVSWAVLISYLAGWVVIFLMEQIAY